MKILAYLVCLSGLATLAARAETFHIVAAENFYGGVAQEIAGPNADVHSILTNPNQDPHEFTSNADTAKEVADADIVIYSGINYDPWMDKLLNTAGKNGRVVIKVSELVGARKSDNPHIWYHVKTMPALAAKLADVLGKLDPAQAAICHQRLDAFTAEMKPLLDKIAAMQSATTGLQVTATEPVFAYMAHSLRMVMLNGDFQIKIMNDAEPTADETAGFEKSLTSKTAKLLFYNSQVTDPTTDRLQKIAHDSGIPVIGVTETQPPDAKNYVDWMMHQLDAIQAALAAPKSP